MTGWRHVERGWDKACGGPSDAECALMRRVWETLAQTGGA